MIQIAHSVAEIHYGYWIWLLFTNLYRNVAIDLQGNKFSLFSLQRAVHQSGERGKGDEKLQQTIQLSLKRIESYMRVSLYFGPDITGVYPVLVAIFEPVFVAVSEVGWGTYANYR